MFYQILSLMVAGLILTSMSVAAMNNSIVLKQLKPEKNFIHLTKGQVYTAPKRNACA